MTEGTIFDIKTFAIHDGPGIRTTVFLKGCPLRCCWCHNPEGLTKQINVWHFSSKCMNCGRCFEACPSGAIAEKGPVEINRSLCRRCGACVHACPTAALAFDGRSVTVDTVMKAVLEDQTFYRASHGGMTLSGGEPTSQPEFATALLLRGKEAYIHTAIESCMYCDSNIWMRFIPLVDQFIVDIKCFDTEKHYQYTGVHNEVILDNFKKIAAEKEQILVRIPLMKQMTGTEENIRAIAAFVRSVRADIPIELINYNPLASGKYHIMGQPYCYQADVTPFSREEMGRFYGMVQAEGARTKHLGDISII